MQQSEYWKEIAWLAEVYNDAAKLEEEAGEGADRDEWLWETLDGHQFVIYTHKARKVLEYSPNDSAYEDETGETLAYNKPEVGALFAMRQDVQEYD
jgi:hypothetical protein